MNKKKKNETDKPKALNIVILPDEKIQQNALGLSQKISEQVETEFILNRTNYRPHITLYQGYYPQHNIQKLITALEEFAAREKPFPVTMNGFRIFHETFVHWNALKTEMLQKLHEKILNLASPYREGLISPNVLEMLPNLSTEEQEMVKTTGGILNKKIFLPHITLTKLKNPADASSILTLLERASFAAFKLSVLTMANLGSHGTISETVTEFNFKKTPDKAP